MRKIFARRITIILLLISILTPLLFVSATKPEGPYYVTTDTTIWDTSGDEPLPNGNVKINWYVEAHWHGDEWDGTVVQYIKGVQRTDEKGNSLITASGWGIYTGTINGKSGSFYYRIRNNILPVPFRFFADHVTIWKGTGDFENLHGYGVLNIFENRVEMYIHFEPNN